MDEKNCKLILNVDVLPPAHPGGPRVGAARVGGGGASGIVQGLGLLLISIDIILTLR